MFVYFFEKYLVSWPSWLFVPQVLQSRGAWWYGVITLAAKLKWRNSLVLFPWKPPEDDDKSPVPADEHRKILPQPDNLLTASFLSGDYCLVGVSTKQTYLSELCRYVQEGPHYWCYRTRFSPPAGRSETSWGTFPMVTRRSCWRANN